LVAVTFKVHFVPANAAFVKSPWTAPENESDLTSAEEVSMDVSQVRSRVGDLRQFASVRRIVLDDGPERGVRALAFSTGGGLDFWGLSDRSMDIGPLTWRGNPIAWQSVTGFRAGNLVNLEADDGRGFMRGFSGMLVTCGLDHVGQAKPGHPLHGQLPYTPARLMSYGEDWECEEPKLYCEAEIDQARHLGEALRLRRRLEAPIGGTKLRIIDRVTNFGAEPQEHQILYHINSGWPALDAGSVAFLDGKPLIPPFEPFPADPKRGSVGFPSGPGPTACCALTLPRLKARLEVRFDVATLPTVKVWRDPRPQCHVLAIEPCTVPLDGDGAAPIILEPGQSRNYFVELSIVDDGAGHCVESK
jgi:hypothetical protein